MKTVGGIAVVLLLMVGGLIGCQRPSAVTPPEPKPETFAFIIAENVYQDVVIEPKRIATSQSISLSEGDEITVILYANCWWEDSLGILLKTTNYFTT